MAQVGRGKAASATVAGPDDAERGSAVVEFTFLTLLFMVPPVYFIITMGVSTTGAD